MAKPEQVIAALKLAPDAAVADIGAGTGYFATRIAKRLPRGKVYAVDVEADMVRYLAERAQRESLPNIVALHSTPTDARLPQGLDVILFVDVYHHVADREGYLRRLRGSLKQNGLIAVIDFRPDAPVGPPRSERIASARVSAEFNRAGYRLVQTHDFLPYQYFLVFQSAP